MYERAILTLMAHRAAMDGTGAWPSIRKMAEFSICDQATVKRRLAAMRKRGLIAYGNQRKTMHLPRDKRPKVYDLLIPFDWYSAAQINEVNLDRAERGAPPLTADMRPPLVMPDRARKTRKDKGQPKTQKKAGTSSSEGLFETPGVLVAPQGDNGSDEPRGGATEQSGGASSTVAGVLLVQSGGASSTPILPLETPTSTSGGNPPPPDPADRFSDSPEVVVTTGADLATQPTTARETSSSGIEEPESRSGGNDELVADVSTASVEVLSQELRDLDGQLTNLAARRKNRGVRFEALQRRADLVSAELTRRGASTTMDPQEFTTMPLAGRRTRPRRR